MRPSSHMGGVAIIALALTLCVASVAQANSAFDPAEAVPAQVAGDVAPATALDSGCGSGNGCVWDTIDFSGSKVVFNTGDAGTLIALGSFDRSAKNNYGNRRMRFFAGNGDLLSCINAGGSDHNLYARTDFLTIGALDNNC